jgi:membrane protein implicated in regulation of membrane protease activity
LESDGARLTRAAANAFSRFSHPSFKRARSARRELVVSFWSSLLAWGNVPFTVAVGVAVVFTLLSLSGALGWLAGDGDGDDADGHDADGDADGDDADDADGEGRLPMSVAWQTFAMVFGIVGLAMNSAFVGSRVPTVSLLWTLPVSALAGWVATRLARRLLARLTSGSEATSRGELVGQAGIVISSRVNAEFGEVRIKDKHGHVLRVVCRSETEIPEGHEVVVIDTDADRVLVTPLER